MREILFRAKTIPNCKDIITGKIIKTPKWIYGYVDLGYMHDCGVPIISDEKGNKTYKCQYETIGQYTGLTDKNGTKIFEGDIVEFYFFDKTRRNGELVEVKNTKTMVIEWDNCSFYMRELYRNYRLDKELGIVTEIIYDYKNERKQGVYKSNHIYFVEVIGNIHDNPELLEVGENG